MAHSPAPSLLAGLRLKRARRSDCASGLRYSGIPNLERRIWFMVSLRFSPWKGSWPVSISYWKESRN